MSMTFCDFISNSMQAELRQKHKRHALILIGKKFKSLLNATIKKIVL